MTLRTSTVSENKDRYKSYYKQKKERELQNKLLFDKYGGEVAYYRQEYVKLINEFKSFSK